MTTGLNHPQISIILNTPDKFDETGIVGWIEMFGSSNYSIIIRPGVIIVDGAAYLSPDKARIFIKALDAAARLAENYHEDIHGLHTNSHEDLT